MKRPNVRKLVADALRDVADAMNVDRPQTWPDSTDADRAASDAANGALDVVERALIKVADSLLVRPTKPRKRAAR